MASVKFVPVSRGLKVILDYVTNREKTVDRLITGVNCVASSALDEFEAVKKQFHKTDGRAYYHIIQAFSPDDPLDFDTAHEIGIKFAEHFSGFQCVVVTHMNTAHIHNHIVMNSVSYETGRKFHQTAREMAQVKEFSNELCQQYGLSITETKADPFRVPKWKDKLRRDVRTAPGQVDDTHMQPMRPPPWGHHPVHGPVSPGEARVRNERDRPGIEIADPRAHERQQAGRHRRKQQTASPARDGAVFGAAVRLIHIGLSMPAPRGPYTTGAQGPAIQCRKIAPRSGVVAACSLTARALDGTPGDGYDGTVHPPPIP